MSAESADGGDDVGTEAAGAPSSDSETASPVAELGHRLTTVRTDPRQRAVALVLAVGLGLALAWLHWFGLVLAGALVGLISATLWRAVVAAAGFGVFVVGLFVIGLGEATPLVLDVQPIVFLTVASAIGLPVFGSLIRGVV